MIQPQELRIGNLVKDQLTGELLRIAALSDTGDVITHVINREKYPLPDGWQMVPIPLSEEWLKRFGFKYHGGFRDSFYNDVLELYGSPVAKGYQVESMFDHHWPVEIHRKVVVEYVHQLQNLYFALTGEELTLKGYF